MPENKSRVLSFMHEHIETLHFDPDFEPEKKVTVRLRQSLVDELDAVAAKLHMSRTMCAERLLTVAINEASVYVVTDPILIAEEGFPVEVVHRIEELEQNEELMAALGAAPREEVAA